jgi:hypothetical protein
VTKSARSKRARRLQKALESQDLVRLRRQKDADRLEGYVVAIGKKWLVLNVATAGEPNGWAAVRLSDIRNNWEARGKRFQRRAFELAHAWPPAPPTLPLAVDGSVRELIESAAAAYPLVTIFVEDDDPNICFIGEPVGWTPRKLIWRNLDLDASWEAYEVKYKLSDITRLDIGGRYESLLGRVADL